MAMRALARRLISENGLRIQPRTIQRAGYSESQRVLNEEEKAAENVYIRTQEREHMQRVAKKSAAAAAAEAESTSKTEIPPVTEEQAEATKTKGIAIAAGLVAVIAAYLWLSPKGKDKKKDSE